MTNHDPQFQAAVELVGKRWAGAIVWALQGGPARFNDLLHSIPGSSDRMISARLNEMTDKGLIERLVDPGPPTRITYGLTAKGRALGPVLRATKRWAES